MAQYKQQTHIPFAYRLIFTWLDPLACLAIAYQNWAAPETIMEAFVFNYASSEVSYHRDLAPLFHLIASSFMLTGLFSAVLLRYSDDVGLWKRVQFCVWLVDVSLLASKPVVLSHDQGWGAMLRAENWAPADAVAIGLFLARSFLILGVGLRTANQRKKTI